MFGRSQYPRSKFYSFTLPSTILETILLENSTYTISVGRVNRIINTYISGLPDEPFGGGPSISVAMVLTSGIIRIRLCIKPLFHAAVNVKINCRHKAGFMDGNIIRWKIPSSEQPSIRADSTMLCKGIIFRYIRIK